jgi:hypothetical protein
MKIVNLVIHPRKSISWEEFLNSTSGPSISLDGYVNDAPNYSEHTKHVNFDHHHGVVREATMATAEQVYMAVKGGLFESFRNEDGPFANVYINDCDQDTCLAIFILENYKMFEGVNSFPQFNRLLNIDSKLDITGGAYPMNLRDELVKTHEWVMEPYTDLRKSGALANANAEVMNNCVEAICARIHKFLMGEAGKVELDIRYEIIKSSKVLNGFHLVKEIGGNSARYHLFSKGMNAFISVVAKREDGKYVYSIGRRSRYIKFPVKQFYILLNEKEGIFERDNSWGGSDIIGGSPRTSGSKLEPEEVFDVIENYLQQSFSGFAFDRA